MRNINELKDIADKLYNEYGSGLHWVITRAEKAESGNWILSVHEEKKQPKKEGAKNDSNK